MTRQLTFGKTCAQGSLVPPLLLVMYVIDIKRRLDTNKLCYNHSKKKNIVSQISMYVVAIFLHVNVSLKMLIKKNIVRQLFIRS